MQRASRPSVNSSLFEATRAPKKSFRRRPDALHTHQEELPLPAPSTPAKDAFLQPAAPPASPASLSLPPPPDSGVMTSESIALLIAREYPPSTGPPPHLIYNLLKSVTTTTAGSSSPAADWAIGDWVEFLGPDQAWHLARITRVDEDR